MYHREKICFFHTGAGLPHVLLGEGPAQVGGAEVQLTLLGRELRSRGWPVSFVVNDYDQPDVMVTDTGIQVVKAANGRGGLPFVRFLTRTVPGCVRAFRRVDPQVCIQRGPQWHSALLVRECRRKDARFILWLAHDDHVFLGVPSKCSQRGLRRRAAFWAMRHADVVIAQTREQQRLMRQLYGISCPIVPNLWPARQPERPRSPSPEVLWVARYDDFKRPQMVLELARRLPDLKFTMVGGPVRGREALFEQIRAAAQRVPNLEVVGFVPFAAVDEYYARAWALLATSTAEGFPNTFLQAWDHRVAIASTVDPDGVLTEHGIGIHGRDLDSLAEAISRLCHSEEGTRMGLRGRAYLERFHSVERAVTLLEAVLMGCLDPRGDRRTSG